MAQDNNDNAPPPTAPPQPATPATQSEPAAKAHSVPHLELKALALVAFTFLLVIGTAIYLMYARGVFEAKQTVVLIADDSEGVTPGMDLTFSGFPIGRVRRVELGDQGNVRIVVDVNKRDAKWLRTSSVYTLVKGLVGGAQLRAYSGVLTDPPLPDNAERPVLRGDANAELQRVIGAARDVFDNLNAMTQQGSELNKTFANLETFSRKLQSKQGALHAIFGNEKDAAKIVEAVDKANQAMARLDQLMAKADTQVFGREGLATEARSAIREAHALLSDARASMKNVDKVLLEAQGAAANVKGATADLGAMRADVETNLRKIEDLINDLQRKWPFAKERKIELP
ncbi:MlaD family protein [Ramlibacter albus]|uniref:MCE family protein n=1 Tax=Ramlibacter albus TaxID=2079448 RepID=A0A923M3K0_9BURK|nr:MlaD family protein [Ramlibacter albus]MBC5763231.1 MCE family protein [Ramlibacter albus]